MQEGRRTRGEFQLQEHRDQAGLGVTARVGIDRPWPVNAAIWERVSAGKRSCAWNVHLARRSKGHPTPGVAGVRCTQPSLIPPRQPFVQ
jgi:hypothetical protein